MNESSKSKHLWLNVTLIALETFFSFILTHDATLRLQAQKLIQKKTTIRINSYIPFFDFYIQFTEKGILFDLAANDRTIDVEINTTLIDLIKIFIFSNQQSLYNMRIMGKPELTTDLTDVLQHLTLSRILVNWREWFNHFENDAEAVASQQRITPLLDKIDQQRSEINTLLVEAKQYQNRIHRMQKRQRLINIGFAVLSFIFIAFFVYNMWIQ
ncbi:MULTISPECIES: hypothetical protein [Acinetobacter]|jgi:uncharacterized membrane protein|uniref:SCP2 domain-containing protein n=2 Tax=Acinetobacter TaxID=469 RepID=N8RUH7_9GAMM|nr:MULTISPECIES: hypothetical protein [Acinetobacter]MBP7883993.1 hypothetical protein [Acinetobacter sp.]ENU37219.1 hypothetical protein F988_00602 [Acinetobacter parvus DSM 16617 = CIP 108168]ENU82241.1 hypothetical protein F974_02761 [Acinetobacter sp. CIP 102159]ENU87494.1 hypothetical protein F973_00414 [Acinetobacter sp. CIP 102129]ENU89563.1 hypothetical protein F972_01017 [Acinetobacter sp. CIP 102529]